MSCTLYIIRQKLEICYLLDSKQTVIPQLDHTLKLCCNWKPPKRYYTYTVKPIILLFRNRIGYLLESTLQDHSLIRNQIQCHIRSNISQQTLSGQWHCVPGQNWFWLDAKNGSMNTCNANHDTQVKPWPFSGSLSSEEASSWKWWVINPPPPPQPNLPYSCQSLSLQQLSTWLINPF